MRDEQLAEYGEQCTEAYSDVLPFRVSTKMLFPDQAQRISESNLLSFAQNRENARKGHNLGYLFEHAATMKCLFPTIGSELTSGEKETIISMLSVEKRREIHSFLEIAMYVKMFAPELLPDLTNEDWLRIRSAFEHRKVEMFRHSSILNVWEFLLIATQIKVLGAEKVIITPTEFKIVMPEKSAPGEIPPQPETAQL